jgi:hypothetical protein
LKQSKVEGSQKRWFTNRLKTWFVDYFINKRIIKGSE